MQSLGRRHTVKKGGEGGQWVETKNQMRRLRVKYYNTHNKRGCVVVSDKTQCLANHFSLLGVKFLQQIKQGMLKLIMQHIPWFKEEKKCVRTPIYSDWNNNTPTVYGCKTELNKKAIVCNLFTWKMSYLLPMMSRGTGNGLIISLSCW